MCLSLFAALLELADFVDVWSNNTCGNFLTFHVAVLLVSILDTLLLGLVFKRRGFRHWGPTACRWAA